MMSSWTSVAVWMNSMHRGVQHRALAGITGHPRRHQQDRRADPLAAAVLDVVADRRNDGHLRLHVTRELALDLAEVVANRLEHLCENGGGGVLRGGIHAAFIRPYPRAECQRA